MSSSLQIRFAIGLAVIGFALCMYAILSRPNSVSRMTDIRAAYDDVDYDRAPTSINSANFPNHVTTEERERTSLSRSQGVRKASVDEETAEKMRQQAESRSLKKSKSEENVVDGRIPLVDQLEPVLVPSGPEVSTQLYRRLYVFNQALIDYLASRPGANSVFLNPIAEPEQNEIDSREDLRVLRIGLAYTKNARIGAGGYDSVETEMITGFADKAEQMKSSLGYDNVNFYSAGQFGSERTFDKWEAALETSDLIFIWDGGRYVQFNSFRN